MACPYFAPREILNHGFWPHPARLPLGAAWTGDCLASGREMPVPDARLLESCNLGYASACPHLPAQRDWDAVRFSVARAGREQVTLSFICELAHAPIAHGTLTFDLSSETWINPPADPRVHRLAACYLEGYRARQARPSAESPRTIL